MDIHELTSLFKLYPEVFPSGYYRFLGARLRSHIDKETIWFEDGVLLTWIEYKSNRLHIHKGDVKLDQLVSRQQGNGKAKQLVDRLVNQFDDRNIWVEVRKDNHRAIRFYQKCGFETVELKQFNNLEGLVMYRAPSLA